MSCMHLCLFVVVLVICGCIQSFILYSYHALSYLSVSLSLFLPPLLATNRVSVVVTSIDPIESYPTYVLSIPVAEV